MKNIKFKTYQKKQLADTVTPVGLYAKIRDKYPHSLLLESSDYHSKEDSFTYICVNPLVTITAHKNEFTYTVNNSLICTKTIQNNFYQIFEEYKNSIQVDCKPELKSINGFYGYIAYDAVTYFENITLKATPAKSTIPNFKFSFFQFIIAINHFNDKLEILENVEEGMSSEMHTIETLINASSYGLFNFTLDNDETSNCTDEEFKKNVSNAKMHCKRGDVFQLVLSRQFQQQFLGDEFNVYRALRSINPSPYLFYFDYGNFKLMGSSPEAQIKITNNKAIINPIAGTFKRTGNMVKDLELGKQLAADKKENAEHVMLVDLARNDLSKHAKNVEVNVFKEVQYFSHVIHLVSTVQGDAFGKAIEIVGDTFPAGTLSGAPKYKAMELIDKYENQTRGFYGGAVGFIGLDNEVNLAIAIRSFISKNNTLYYQAGAGIVINSTEEGELQEVNNKLAALKKALIMAEEI